MSIRTVVMARFHQLFSPGWLAATPLAGEFTGPATTRHFRKARFLLGFTSREQRSCRERPMRVPSQLSLAQSLDLVDTTCVRSSGLRLKLEEVTLR